MAQKPKVLFCYDYAGGGAGSLDKWLSDGSNLDSRLPLITNDQAHITSALGEDDYRYDSTSTAEKSTSYPYEVIMPGDGVGRWLRVQHDGRAIMDDTITDEGIDWGTGAGQVDVTDIPGAVGLDETGGIAGIDHIVIGASIETEGVETPIQEMKIKNDNDEDLVSYAKTLELTDNTDGTEDVIIREYMLVAGVLGMYSSTKIYTAAPTGAEAPVYGCRVLADRVTWDPASKGSGGAYWVWWDGNSWEVIDGQAN